MASANESSPACEGIPHTVATSPEEATRNLVACIILLVITVFGLTSNTLTLVILKRDSKMHTVSAMTILLAALAVTDLMYLMALTMAYTYVKMADSLVNLGWSSESAWYYCKVGYIGLSLYFPCQMAESWLILSLTVDRFLAVCHPFHYQRLCTVRNARLAVVAIFAASILIHVTIYIHTVHWIFDLDQLPTRVLTITWAISMILGSFVPLVLLTVFNIRLMAELRAVRKRIRLMADSLRLKRRKKCEEDHHDDNPTEKRRSSSSGSAHIISVVVVFWICQTPFLVQYFLYLLSLQVIDPKYVRFTGTDHYLNVMNGLMIINSTINFLLYCLFYRRFREVAGKMLCSSRHSTGSLQMTF